MKLPIIVFANLGDEDNLVPVKRFSTTKEAQAWIDQQKIERPGYYCIASDDEFYPFL